MIRRVLLAGAWDEGPGYPRTETLTQGLRASGIEVSRCRVEAPWLGARKRELLRQPWRWPALAQQCCSVRRKLQRRLVRDEAEIRPDVILVPYPGQLVAEAVAAVSKAPVVMDLFLSAIDAAVGDRRMLSPRSLRARLLGRTELRACQAVSRVLLDTHEHAAAVAQHWGLDPTKVGAVPVGDPDAPAVPYRWALPAAGAPLRVLFCGTGVPLHGLSHLVEGVALARRQGVAVELTLIGGDPASRARAAAADVGARVLGSFEPRSVLAEELARSHLVAGIFGDGAKAQRVIPLKVVHGLAAGRPVLTAATPAVRGLLVPGVDIITCAPGDAAAIADALRSCAQAPQRLAAVAAASRAAFERRFSAAVVGRQLVDQLHLALPGDAARTTHQPAPECHEVLA